MSSGHVLVYGCGKMARAFALGLKRTDPSLRFSCWTPSGEKARALAEELKGTWLAELAIPGDVTAVMLGFKPQNLTTAAPALKGLPPQATVLSLLAAVELRTLAQHFPAHPLLRVMPNLCVQNGQGVVLWAQSGHTATLRATWEKRLQGLGLAAELSEAHIDLYTMHGGSAPAFLYYWLKEAGDFAAERGGDAQLAVQIFAQTLRGALESSMEYAQLQERITAVASKGGVTQAALDEWIKSDGDYLKRGFAAGHDRLKALKS